MSRTRSAIFVALLAGGLVTPWTALAQSAGDDPASLEEQLATQQARNEELRRRIAVLEDVLKTDVCENPEAVRLLRESSTSPRE